MNRRGFTIVELLVVIGIIGVLVALLLPAISAARESARATTCKNNLRQLAVAVDLFYTANKHYPTGQFLGTYGKGPDSTAWSWLARTLPFIERTDLYKAGGLPTTTLRASNILDRRIDLLRCPTDPGIAPEPSKDRGDLGDFAVGLSNYKAVTGSNWGWDETLKTHDIRTDWANPGTIGSQDGQNHGDGVFCRSDVSHPRRKSEINDGLARTLLIGESLPNADRYGCSWGYSNGAYGTCAIPPNVIPKAGSDYTPLWWPNVLSFRSAHSGGLHFAFADAHVAFISDAIDLKVYHALATVRGNEPIDANMIK